MEQNGGFCKPEIYCKIPCRSRLLLILNIILYCTSSQHRLIQVCNGGSKKFWWVAVVVFFYYRAKTNTQIANSANIRRHDLARREEAKDQNKNVA